MLDKRFSSPELFICIDRWDIGDLITWAYVPSVGEQTDRRQAGGNTHERLVSLFCCSCTHMYIFTHTNWNIRSFREWGVGDVQAETFELLYFCFVFIDVGVSYKNKGCTILCLCLFFGCPFKYRAFVRSLHHDLICMVIYIRLNVKVIWHFFLI